MAPRDKHHRTAMTANLCLYHAVEKTINKAKKVLQAITLIERYFSKKETSDLFI